MPSPALVPAPVSLEATDAAPFVLSAGTAVTGDGDAADVLRALIAARTGAQLLRSVGETPASAEFPVDDARIEGVAREITLAIEAPGVAESYRLEVTTGSITVAGADPAGLFYGVQTLGQLIRPRGDGWEVPAATVSDSPRFAYRGVMLDVARHFHDVGTVKAYIDRAAGLKFNVLHLHLSDDQGWRIHIESRPKLTELASGGGVGGDPGGFYRQDEYREIVAYAASRHMTVVPELDVPGHSHAISLAYPELCEPPVLSDHIRDTVREGGGELPVNGTPFEGVAVGFSSLKIREEATYAFLADVFGELAGLTPGPYLHLGGDEALGTDAADFDHFVARASRVIAATGKVPVAWHEAGAAAGLAPGTIGQYWGFVTPTDGMDVKARAFVERGGRLILSPADAIYLDMKQTADDELGLVWANGPTSLHRAYQWDPAAVIEGVGDGQLLGVEAPLWTETVRDLDAIDRLVFPRIAAAAEAAWSVPLGSSDRRTWSSFRERVEALGPLWASLGIHVCAADDAAGARE